MTAEIDPCAHELASTLERNRRRRREAALSEGMAPKHSALLPLSIAIARLSARQIHIGATVDKTTKDPR